MHARAIVLEAPEKLAVGRLGLVAAGAGDVVVDALWSGISSGTERLLYSGRMPAFPGMGYPLVPGYETVGVVREAGAEAGVAVGETVFVPGSHSFAEARCLFGASAERLVVPGSRVVPVSAGLGERGVLLALAATARHALAGHALPELIVGHGVLGRLLARLTVLEGGRPVVWETQAGRRDGAVGYEVVDSAEDARRDYRTVYDVSGDAGVLDGLVGRLAPGGEVVLAGFYSERLSFAFAPAFMREARIRVAAQWQRGDLEHVARLAEAGTLDLGGLLTHRAGAGEAEGAYRTAFEDAGCLKMVLDWSGRA